MAIRAPDGANNFLYNNRVLFVQCLGAGLIQGKSINEKESRNTPAPYLFITVRWILMSQFAKCFGSILFDGDLILTQ